MSFEVATLRALVHTSDKTSGDDNATNDDDLKCWPACCRITRRGTGGRAGKGGGRTKGRSGDQGDGRIDGQGGQVGGQGSEVNDGVNGVPDFSTIITQQLQNLLPTIIAQVGDQGRGQGNGRNQNSDAANDNIRGDLSRGCTYKEFLACNPKEYDGKGGAIAFHELARLVPHLVTPEGKMIERYVYCLALQIQGIVAATEPKTIQKAAQIADKNNPKKRGNRGEPSNDRNVRNDNNMIRIGNDFDTTANPVRGGYTGHFAKDCRVVPRNVNPINVRNQTVRACYACGSANHVKATCPRLNQAQRPGGNPHNYVMDINSGLGRGN
ncbi:reverse transcriptase domain-containing protein [Tanacetum coccineum]